MSDRTSKGSCLCGAVTFEIHGPYLFFQYCHCSRCRKATGSNHAANILIPIENLKWLSGAHLVRRYKLPDAKTFATTFCTQCGSPLPWTTRQAQYVIVPAGSLDDAPESLPDRNIYWASRAQWCVSSEEMVKFPEAPE